MSTVELYDPDIWPIPGGEQVEVASENFEQMRKHIWLIEHPCAGNLDTTELYGKWIGDANTWAYVEYDAGNWAGWEPSEVYHYGSPIVKYRWGPSPEQVDIFMWFANKKGDVLNLNPPVIGGQLNSGYWKLTVDPNKYVHWNKGAGRPDIEADARYIFKHHGQDSVTKEWWYGLWEAWRELPNHTDRFERKPHINITEPQDSPAEQKREWITKQIRPVEERTYPDGTVGTDPVTPWVHSEDITKVSEYAHVSGDPVGSMQVGPSEVDPKFNQALQDRVIHCIENNYQYLKEVDDEWKETWQHWNTYGIEMTDTWSAGCVNKHPDYAGHYMGSLTWPYAYFVGDVVYWEYYWWRCIAYVYVTGPDYSPTGQYGGDKWAKPLHQPNHIPSDPVYVQFSDYLFNCNSSAYEKVLKEVGEYDWWWDDRAVGGFPEVPWWLYQKHYYYMTLHKADPDVGNNVTAVQRYPLPRGCWRKVWRHTMCWDHDREEGQKARLGKQISIDGKMVSMMWPGELGTPPGYDLIERYVGNLGDYYYNYRQKALVITQEQYDNMDTWSYETWTYTQYYIVVDVEELFRQAYRNRSSVESKIAERHDPLASEWLEDEGGSVDEYPIFEMEPDLINDLKAALEQLVLLGQETTITSTDYTAWSDGAGFSTSLDAYSAGKAQCESKTIVYTQSGIYGNVGYVGFVTHDVGVYDNVGSVTLDYQMELAWNEVTITRGVDVCFPATSVGTLIFDILAKAGIGGSAACAIGAGSFVYTPSWDTNWHRAYIGQVPVSCERVYDGDGNDPDDWDLVCKFQIVPAEPWPPNAMFNFVGGVGKDWYQQTIVSINTGSNIAMAWHLNFDGFDESVFEQDPTNCIEIEV